MHKKPFATIVDAEEGIVSVIPPKKKIAIIGTGRSRGKAPFYDYTWECWGLNEIEQPRADRWFEMHPMGVQNDYELNWLWQCNQPVYLLRQSDIVPMGVCYPIERVLEMQGARDYFTSTFAFQVALAILEGFEEIGLWGLRLKGGSPRERTVERMCLEWWLGLAAGKGIKITTCQGDKLISELYQYGYDYFDEKIYIEKQMTDLGLQIALRNNAFAEKICSICKEERKSHELE